MTLELADPIESAVQAGLRYVGDDAPGISRTSAETGYEI